MLEPSHRQTLVPLGYQTPEAASGQQRAFWRTYLLSLGLSLGAIVVYAWADGLAFEYWLFLILPAFLYALPLVAIAFVVKRSHQQWIRRVPLRLQLPLAVVLSWLSLTLAYFLLVLLVVLLRYALGLSG